MFSLWRGITMSQIELLNNQWYSDIFSLFTCYELTWTRSCLNFFQVFKAHFWETTGKLKLSAFVLSSPVPEEERCLAATSTISGPRWWCLKVQKCARFRDFSLSSCNSQHGMGARGNSLRQSGSPAAWQLLGNESVTSGKHTLNNNKKKK